MYTHSNPLYNTIILLYKSGSWIEGKDGCFRRGIFWLVNYLSSFDACSSTHKLLAKWLSCSLKSSFLFSESGISLPSVSTIVECLPRMYLRTYLRLMR